MTMNPSCFVLDRDTLSRIFHVLAHKSNSQQEDMPLYPDTIFWLWADQSMLLLLNAACFAEKQQITIDNKETIAMAVKKDLVFIQTHYSDSGPTSLCSYSLMLRA